MPIHDWTRVRANRFHDFHQSWTISIRNALNAGLLPPGFFAMAEQITGGPEADVVTTSGGLAVEMAPPKARIVTRSDAANYARKANRITIRHPDGEVVAVIEIISPGNKDSRYAIRAFARKAVDFLQAGIHLLIVDLFPPHQQNQIRYQLADTLQGVISQRLLRRADIAGRIPAVEVMVVTPLVKKAMEENNLAEVANALRQGGYYGMQTFNQSLVKLYHEGKVKLEDALAAASNPEEVMLAVRGIESGSDASKFFTT